VAARSSSERSPRARAIATARRKDAAARSGRPRRTASAPRGRRISEPGTSPGGRGDRVERRLPQVELARLAGDAGQHHEGDEPAPRVRQGVLGDEPTVEIGQRGARVTLSP
jgi:hypothetical protein